MTYYSRTGNREFIRERNRKKRQIKVNLELTMIGVVAMLFVMLIIDSTIGKQVFRNILADALGQEVQEVVTESIVQAASTGNTQNEIKEIQNVESKGLYFTKPKEYNSSEIKERLENLSEFSEDYKYVYEHMTDYPENLLRALCNNGELLPFVLGYTDGKYESGVMLSDSERLQKIPLLMQWDKRWGYKTFGDDCMGLSGCGPTCLSMVAIGLTGNDNLTPDYMADFAMDNGYYDDGVGTAWSFMTEGANYFGIKGEELTLSKQSIIESLNAGHPIICSMREGDFTTKGHYIVLIAEKNGKLVINDPNCNARSSVLWEYDDIQDQIKNMWTFTKE